MPNGHCIFQCTLLGSIKGLRPFFGMSFSHTKEVYVLFFFVAKLCGNVVYSLVLCICERRRQQWRRTETKWRTTTTIVSGEFVLWVRACHMNYCRKKLHLFSIIFPRAVFRFVCLINFAAILSQRWLYLTFITAIFLHWKEPAESSHVMQCLLSENLHVECHSIGETHEGGLVPNEMRDASQSRCDSRSSNVDVTTDARTHRTIRRFRY